MYEYLGGCSLLVPAKFTPYADESPSLCTHERERERELLMNGREIAICVYLLYRSSIFSPGCGDERDPWILDIINSCKLMIQFHTFITQNNESKMRSELALESRETNDLEKAFIFVYQNQFLYLLK